jgi:ribosomal protein S18 acetylase RimI-like enzyme
MEIEALDGVFDEYFEEFQAEGHKCVTYERHGEVLGFAYYAPTWMTDHTWYLWWIAVKKQTQARGVGTALLRHLEEDIRAAGGRLLLIETSSLPSYEPTRRFYLKHHYEQEAVLRDYYADGDSMVVFSKRLT